MFLIQIISLFLIILVILSLSRYVRKYKQRALTNKHTIEQLNEILNVLNKKSKTEIYIYNLEQDSIQKLNDGKLEPVDRLKFHMSSLLHPDDKMRYNNEHKLALDGKLNHRSAIYRMFNSQTNKYSDYEFAMTSLEVDANGKTTQFIFSKKDVTEQMEQMREQQKLLDTLKLSMSSIHFFYWHMDIATQEIEGVDNSFAPFTIPFQTVLTNIAPKDRLKIENLYCDVLQTKKQASATILFKSSKDNTYRPYEVSTNVTCDASGKPITFYGVTRDVSDTYEYKMQLNEKVRLLEAIKEDLPLGMAFFDKNGIMREVNSKHVEMFGTRKEVALSSNVNLFNFSYLPQSALDDLRAGKSIQFDISSDTIYQKLSQYTTISEDIHKMFTMRYSPICDKEGEIMGYISLFDDKTEEFKLMHDLREAKDKAVESEKLKMAFLANMSHEIRTPLNAIVGFTELMQYTTDPIEQHEYMNIINTNTELLLRLINDVLDLSKIESGMIDLRRDWFDLSAAFNETYATFKNKNNNPNIEFIEDNPFDSCFVYLDRNRLLQVIMNFVTNAMKHTSNGSITMGYSKAEGGIRIYVKDTGSGIPQEKQHLIFKRFQKLNTFVQGIGLGLTICKAIIDTVGGRIGFESEENVGTTFWAWVPCQPEVVLKSTDLSSKHESEPEPEPEAELV